MGLSFSLFNITSAQEMPFGMPQFVQCILQRLSSVLLCTSFLLTVTSINLVVEHNGFLFVTKNFIVATLITEVLSKQFLIHTAV